MGTNLGDGHPNLALLLLNLIRTLGLPIFHLPTLSKRIALVGLSDLLVNGLDDLLLLLPPLILQLVPRELVCLGQCEVLRGRVKREAVGLLVGGKGLEDGFHLGGFGGGERFEGRCGVGYRYALSTKDRETSGKPSEETTREREDIVDVRS